MNKAIRIFVIAFLLAACAGWLVDMLPRPAPVKAAPGITTVTYNITQSDRFGNFKGVTPHSSYSDAVLETTYVDHGGWTWGYSQDIKAGGAPWQWITNHTNMAFNLTSLDTSNVTILDVKLRIYPTYKFNNTGGVYSYFFAKMNDPNNQYNSIGDRLRWYNYPGGKERISDVKSYAAMTVGSWVEFDVADVETGGFDYIINDADGWVWFTFMNNYQYYLYSPYNGDSAPRMDMEFYGWGSAHPPELVVTFASEAADRVIESETNAAVYPTPLGTENVTSIDWGSPRCAFGDEDLYFVINGDAGANITASLVTDTGAVLATLEDSVRTDGDYNWLIDIDDVTSGYWCRVIDASGIRSDWGRVEPSPGNQRLLDINALDTSYPQYDYSFNRFIVKQNGLFYYFWKTNMVLGDFPNYELRLYAGGDNSTVMFSDNFSSLNSSYYETAYSSNEYLAHWRYMIFTPLNTQPGFNTRDGLIYDVAREYTFDNAGFWEPVIAAVSDNNVITWAHSSVYYLNNDDQGVYISLQAASFAQGDDITAKIEVGSHSKIPSRLSKLNIKVVGDDGTVVSQTGSFVETGENSVTFTAPAVEGDYQARFVFYDEELVPEYEYIKDIAFTVGTGSATPGSTVPTVGGWQQWLKEQLQGHNLDNTGGHWIVLFVVCIVLAVAFKGQPFVAAALIILAIVGAFILDWLDPWFMVLVTIGAGAVIYGVIKKAGRGHLGV